MVMNSTRAVEVIIQAVSPELRTGAATSSAAIARLGITRDNRAPSPANLRRVILFSPGALGLWRRLNRVGIGFAGTDANRLFQIDHEDLAVTDLAGVGGLGYRLDNPVQILVVNGDIDLYLRQEIDHVFRAAIQLGVTLLPTEAFDFSNGNALHADLGQRLAHVVQFERLDDGSD